MKFFLRSVFLVFCMIMHQVHIHAKISFNVESIVSDIQGGSNAFNQGAMQVIDSSLQGFNAWSNNGELDRLFIALGQNPEEMNIRQGRGLWSGTWYWDYDPAKKVVGKKNCDSDGNNCEDIYASAPTAKELQKQNTERITKILQAYIPKGNYATFQDVQSGLDELKKDMYELRSHINMVSSRKLDSSGEHLKTELNRIMQVGLIVKNQLEQYLEFSKFEDVLHYNLPSQKALLEQSLKELDEKIKSSDLDKASYALYQKVKEYLLKIQKIVSNIKNSAQSLEDAQKNAVAKLKRLEEEQKFNTVIPQAQKAEIDLYKEVVAELELELNKEEKYEGERLASEDRAKETILSRYLYTIEKNKFSVGLQKSLDALDFALSSAQIDLSNLQGELHRLSLATAKDKKKKEIEQQEIVIQLLKKELSALESIKSLHLQRARELITKHGDVIKALKHLGVEYDKSGRKNYVKGRYNPDNAFTVEMLEQIKKESDEQAQQNDPVKKAKEALAKAKIADVPAASQNLIFAHLEKSGFSVDKLSMDTRQQLAMMLKKGSDQLIEITQNLYLTEQQKQIQKNQIVKDLSIDTLALVTAARTGGDFELTKRALISRKVEDLQGAAIQAAANNLINALVPTPVIPVGSDFGLGTFDGSYQNSSPSVDPKMQAYTTLGLQPGASLEDIKRAYKTLALQTHPDKNLGDPTAADKFKKVNEAYQTLVAL